MCLGLIGFVGFKGVGFRGLESMGVKVGACMRDLRDSRRELPCPGTRGSGVRDCSGLGLGVRAFRAYRFGEQGV